MAFVILTVKITWISNNREKLRSKVNLNDEQFNVSKILINKELSYVRWIENNYKINGKISSESDYELPTKIKIDKYFRFCNFQTGFGVYSFSRLNDFSGGGFFNRKTFCDRS